jgi:hypothetical protein
MFIHCCSDILPSRCLATYTYRHTDLWEGFMKCAVELGSDAVIYIPNFIKIGVEFKS